LLFSLARLFLCGVASKSAIVAFFSASLLITAFSWPASMAGIDLQLAHAQKLEQHRIDCGL
jgi:hypothetical protein